MSSKYETVSCRPHVNFFICFVKVAGAPNNTNLKHVKAKFPSGDEKAEYFFESSVITIFQYPRDKSILVKKISTLAILQIYPRDLALIPPNRCYFIQFL